jgi:hypothetical protein
MFAQIRNHAVAAVLAGASLLAIVAPAAGITLDELSWQTSSIDDTGAIVIFQAIFVNNGEGPSEPVSGELNPQPFGAFVENFGDLICGFEIPSLGPGEKYTVGCEVPLDALPPGAEIMIPGEGEVICPDDNFWSNGVEAAWTGDGDGQEAVHRGTLQVCPVEGCSFIRVIADCPEGAPWGFPDGCAGFGLGLVDNEFNPAPNPLPPGLFEGWICVETVAFGGVCSFDLEFTCGARTAEVHMVTAACDCALPTGVEPSTWGWIKQRLAR